MAIKKTSLKKGGARFATYLDKSSLDKKTLPRHLRKSVSKNTGRNSGGRITIRHQGGGEQRLLRKIDFKRDKKDIEARVSSIEYDPNRGANIVLLVYKDGEKRYIIAPADIKKQDMVVSKEKAEIKPGNAMFLANIPVGTPIHNLEILPGKGGQVVRGAGTSALIMSKEAGFATVKLPSGEQKKFKLNCLATIGQVSNPDKKTVKLGKAGRKRHMGIRPSVRGLAQHPKAHPHGGGEGRSGIGMPSPKSPWGKKTLGKRTRKLKKYSDKLIVKHKK
jgi:large subunit ribosomal protein L2